MDQSSETSVKELNGGLLEWYLTLPALTAAMLRLTWSFRYGRLSVRRVDLVGDYAGQELFLLEGDSLLLRCFSDAQLEFDRKCDPQIHHLMCLLAN